jgi:hypothetical protein
MRNHNSSKTIISSLMRKPLSRHDIAQQPLQPAVLESEKRPDMGCFALHPFLSGLLVYSILLYNLIIFAPDAGPLRVCRSATTDADGLKLTLESGTKRFYTIDVRVHSYIYRLYLLASYCIWHFRYRPTTQRHISSQCALTYV